MRTIPRPSLPPQAARREWRDGVTFHAFRRLAEQCGWTAESLAERFAGAFGGPRSDRFYETPAAYLRRVLRRGHARDDDTVIPYRCLIQLYVDATSPPQHQADQTRR